MGSRIKTMLFGRSLNKDNETKFREGRSYDSFVASTPPVKGSFPVAGNGHAVLDQTQRARANSVSVAAHAPRQRDQSRQRPRAASSDGEHIGSKAGRTMSGFSMKSPPNFLRRNSTKSNTERSPPSESSPPPIPRLPSLRFREVKTYVPTNSSTNPNATANSNTSSVSSNTPAQPHTRNSSQSSHRTFVDLLDAHSTIDRTREASLHRYKASGVRNYGEDVADRNIGSFGSHSDRKQQDSRLDLNSPEFSYLKSVYSPKTGVIQSSESISRVSSALGHVLGPAEGNHHDDTVGAVQPSTNSNSPRSGPLHSKSRADPASAIGLEASNTHYHARHNGALDFGESRGRASSLLTSPTAPQTEEARGHKPFRSLNSIGTTSSTSERGRSRAPTVTTTTTTSTSTVRRKLLRNPPPVPPPESFPTTFKGRSPASTTPGVSASKSTRRSSSAARQSTAAPTRSGTSSRKGSVTFAAFGSPDQVQTLPSPMTNTPHPQRRMMVEGSSQPISLDGIVDLTDSVDTEVITKQLPAVTHEHVIPTRHEIREEIITREIHTHDVYHRVLPVIETEILPTKHYIRGQDGKSLIEIPESLVAKHNVTGRLDQNWHISKPGPNYLSNGDSCETASRASTDSAPDGPVISLARSDGRGKPGATSYRSPPMREPILSSKRESITKDGIPRTEYVWRHPPVFETADGKTQPVHIGAGLSDVSGDDYYTEEDDEYDELSGGYGSARTPNKEEEELLFRESGYGVGGMLPGLVQPTPTGMRKETTRRAVGEPPVMRAKGPSNPEGAETKLLKNVEVRRRGVSAASKTSGLEESTQNLSIR